MQPTNEKILWREWLKISRLIPLVTVLVALAIGILTLLNRFQTSLAEGIIITLLALLATDTLIELSLLEKIESKVSALAYKTSLPSRPHMHLIRRESEKWFEFFATQFEQLWSEPRRRQVSGSLKTQSKSFNRQKIGLEYFSRSIIL